MDEHTETLTLQVNTEILLVPRGEPSRRTLELMVRAPRAAQQEQRAAINLALVLDRSGSMRGPKLDFARQAASHVLDLLSEGDRAALVAYDDEVLVLAESTPVTAASRAEFKRRLDQLNPGGSTNLSGGWARGCEQVALHMDSGGGAQVDRTLLLTDGLANAGITDLEELSVHARNMADRGVSTSTFGVGAGYNEYLLEAMAQQGRGSFYFIAAPSDISEIFKQEFEELSAITARDVEIELDLPAGASAEVLGGVSFQALGQKLRISIGSLMGGREEGVYINLALPALAEGEITLRAVARALGLDGVMMEAAGVLVFRCAPVDEVRAAPLRQDVLERAAVVKVSHVANESLKMERAGKGREGSARLREALAAEHGRLDGRRDEYYQQLARRMEHGMDEMDRKASHYGTYMDRKQRGDRSHLGGGESTLLLERLMRDGAVRMRFSPLLMSMPPRLPDNLSFDRVEGMLLGLAVGDALGNTSESMTAGQRRALLGEITGYLPNSHAGGQTVGLPSDDTQMAFWTVETLLDEGRLNPELLARRFSRERIYGIGSSVREFLRNFKDRGELWHRAGAESAGNGAIMRIAPVLLPHLRRPSPNLWADAALAGMVTHNDYASNAACVAFVAILWDLLGMQSVSGPEWWAEAYCARAEGLEGPTAYQARMPGVHYQGPVWQFVRDEVARAVREGWTTVEASNYWGSGAYLLETIPNALYILARYANDPREAILRAVNDTHDNDTVAALVGTAVGALHGKSALPEEWRSGLLGRTNDRNNGHIFHLIEEVRKQFWEK